MFRGIITVACVALFLLAPSAAGGSLPAEVAEHVDEFVTGRMETWGTPGASLVVVIDGHAALVRGYGYADVEAGQTMTEDTLLVLGSTTKAMTALAVMQLVERGLIDLDAPVTRYLPWFTTPEGLERKIIVRHLLSHSSGYPWGILFTGNRYPTELEDYVRWLGRIRLEAEPGARFGYSNDTFVVLGLIIEEVAGVPYEDYMRRYVFGPLAMNRTTFDIEEARQRGLAQGYRNRSGVAERFDVDFAPSERPAGKLMTSGAELVNYLTMLLAGGSFEENRLLSDASLLEMWTPVVQVDDSDIYYGLAWYLGEAGGLKVVSHPGSVRNSGSRFLLVPEAGLAIGVLSNISRPLDPRNEIVEGIAIATLIFGDYALDPRTRAVLTVSDVDRQSWQEVVGTYSSAAGPVEIFIDGDLLAGKVAGHRFELDPAGDMTFTIRSDFGGLDGLELEFQPSDSGQQSWHPGHSRLAVMDQWFAFKNE